MVVDVSVCIMLCLKTRVMVAQHSDDFCSIGCHAHGHTPCTPLAAGACTEQYVQSIHEIEGSFNWAKGSRRDARLRAYKDALIQINSNSCNRSSLH